MPAVGLGYWKVEQAAAAALTLQAVKIGYRHLDCACDYGNEANVGEGIAQVVRQGLCNRDELHCGHSLFPVRGALVCSVRHGNRK